MNNESTVEEYMDTLSLLQRDKEEVKNVILGYMTDCQEKDKRMAELTAHVERLHEFFHDHVPNYEETIEVYTPDLYDLLDETPAQSLNEIKAQAIEEAVAEYAYLNETLNEWICDDEDLAHHVKQLRGEK